MSVEIVGATGGILTVKVTGMLTQPELASMQQAAVRTIHLRGKVRLLAIVEKFEGWDRKSDWGDVSFQTENDESIERMAIVADKKWEELTSLFTGKGMRKFPIRYFQPSEIDKARAWVSEDA